MGAGAGAAAAINNKETSPRGSAIEKAQAELRRDLAVREERRRELEFLEKGGDPLDFNFEEAPPAQFLPLSPTAPPLADQLLKSEGEGGWKQSLVANGDISTSFQKIVVRGEAPNEDNCEILLGLKNKSDTLNLICRSKLSEPKVYCTWKSSDSRPEKDGECTNVDIVVSKSQTHVKRNRNLSQRLGNGLTTPTEVENSVGAGSPIVKLESKLPSVPLEDEAMVDMSYQVLPRQFSHAVSRKWSCLTSSLEFQPENELMARRGSVLDQHATDAKSRNPILSHISVQSTELWVGSHVDANERERVSQYVASGGHVEQVDSSTAHVQKVGEVDGLAARKNVEDIPNVVAASKNSFKSREEGGIIRQTGNCSLRAENKERTDPVVVFMEKTSNRHKVGEHTEGQSRTVNVLTATTSTGVPGGATLHRNTGLAKKNAASRGGNLARSASRRRLAYEEKRAGAHHARIKFEGGVANKAREDYILEEAGNVKAKKKFMEEWYSVVKSPEPSRRKTHWEFVLEEMSWLAKDVFQERRWKIENAARIGQSVAYEKSKDECLASDIVKGQRKRASFLALAVNKFWRKTEASLTKGKAGPPTHDKSGTVEGTRNEKNETEAVPMDVDIPASREALEKSLQSENLEKENLFGIEKYAVDYLKAIGCVRIAEAVAPATPEQCWERNGILYFFDQERFSKEPLYYNVPFGAMEAYRVSIEMERARAEVVYEEKRAAAVAEADAQADAETSGDASLGTGFGFSDFLVDRGFQEDEFQTNFMGEGGHARISKKKRKKIYKSSNVGSKFEGIGLRGFAYQSSDMSTPDMGAQSPIVTGKRALPGESGSSSAPGCIPVKRARSSATNLRPRASHSSISLGTTGVCSRAGSGSQNQREDEGVGMLDGSNRLESVNDIPSSKTHGVGGIGGFCTNKLKKKKKTKAFQGLSNLKPYEGGLPASPPGKSPGEDSQELVGYEQVKQKGDSNWPLAGTTSDALLAGTPTDTQETPGSQVRSGQQLVKKQKSLKQNEAKFEAANPAPLHTIQQLPSVPSANKLSKQSSMRDRNRRVRPNKVPPSTPTGVGIPWSASEDQAILALVHDLGPNWELVSDVLSSNSQIKGVYRKPKQCKERHRALTERSNLDGMESPEDQISLQPQGLKGNVRVSRVHGAPDEDSLKHLECIVQLVLKYRGRKNSSDVQDLQILAVQHPSHGIAVSQFCTGGPPNPLELCDRVANNGDATSLSHPIQPAQGNVLGALLMPSSARRAPSGGLPTILPGSTGLPLGQSSVSSSAAMSAAAARDAQRFTTRLSPEEATRLRMAAGNISAYNARRLQQQEALVTAGLPILTGLLNPSDLPMLPTSTGAMLGALSRGLSMPRPGLSSMGSPVVSSMGSSGLSGMVPPAGTLPSPTMSRRTANLLNMLRMGRCTEEQRLQILQQLQLQAQQGDNQAAAALSNLSNDMAAMISSPPQPFPPQHHSLQLQQQQQQHHHYQQQPHLQLQHQQQQQHEHQQHQQSQQQQQMQMQANPTQAYYTAAAAAARMKEQQHRQQQTLQHQQKHRLTGTLPPTLQPQHMLISPYPPRLSSLNPPQSHILSQQPQQSSNQLGQQQGAGLPSQAAQPAFGPSGLHLAPASPAGSGRSNSPAPHMPAVQLGQASGSARPPQGKQLQKYLQQTPQTLQHQTPQTLHQQQVLRNSRGPSRESMMMQNLSSQTGQQSTSPNSLSSGGNQSPNETSGQMQSGQEVQEQSGQVQDGKASSGSQPSGLSQSPGSLVQGGTEPQILPSGVFQNKGLQQSQSQQQMVQGGVPKKQQGSLIQAAAQAALRQPASLPTSSQQLQQPLTVPPAQQMQRLQVLQPQHSQRRLQTQHLSATPLGMPMPGKMAGMQQTGSGVTQITSLPNHTPYQLGATATIGNPFGMSDPNSHGLPWSSLNSNTSGAHSTQLKSNQANAPLSGGIYNLTRTNSPGPGQVLTMTTSGLQSPSLTGTTAVSSLPNSGSHGMSLGRMPQNLSGTRGVSSMVQNQKIVVSPGVNGRVQQEIHSGQCSQQVTVFKPSGNSQTMHSTPSASTNGLPNAAASSLAQGGAPVVPFTRAAVP